MRRSNWALPAIFMLVAAPALLAGPCLLNPTDTVGNSVFGATVQTFMDYGIDPNTTCIENGIWTNPSNFWLGSYVTGAEASGGTADPTSLTYNLNSKGSIADDANGLDFYWVCPYSVLDARRVGSMP